MSRTSRSDGAVTRAKILEVAGTLIAEQGYAQTTNKEIASAAGVDLATINYHFNGRDGLYLAVLSEAYRYFLDGSDLEALSESTMSQDEKLEKLIEICLPRSNEQNDWHRRVYTKELLSPSPLFNEFIKTEGMGKRQVIFKIISQISGLAENDPRFIPCLFSIIGPCMMITVAGKFTSSTLNGIAATMSSSELITHFKTFSLAGINSLKQSD